MTGTSLPVEMCTLYNEACLIFSSSIRRSVWLPREERSKRCGVVPFYRHGGPRFPEFSQFAGSGVYRRKSESGSGLSVTDLV